jgi:splicing factor 1
MLDDNYCDNCQMEGHRTWACPFPNLNQTNKINIKCEICGENSHPTTDCPERTAYLKRAQADNINKLL